MTTIPVRWEQITDLPKGSPRFCFYADDDPAHPPAVRRVHDARGCVSTCDHCARWRAGQLRAEGHGETCPDHGALASGAA